MQDDVEERLDAMINDTIRPDVIFQVHKDVKKYKGPYSRSSQVGYQKVRMTKETMVLIDKICEIAKFKNFQDFKERMHHIYLLGALIGYKYDKPELEIDIVEAIYKRVSKSASFKESREKAIQRVSDTEANALIKIEIDKHIRGYVRGEKVMK